MNLSPSDDTTCYVGDVVDELVSSNAEDFQPSSNSTVNDVKPSDEQATSDTARPTVDPSITPPESNGTSAFVVTSTINESSSEETEAVHLLKDSSDRTGSDMSKLQEGLHYSAASSSLMSEKQNNNNNNNNLFPSLAELSPSRVNAQQIGVGHNNCFADDTSVDVVSLQDSLMSNSTFTSIKSAFSTSQFTVSRLDNCGNDDVEGDEEASKMSKSANNSPHLSTTSENEKSMSSNLRALDLPVVPLRNVSGGHSVSSRASKASKRSVRRRDVIKPVAVLPSTTREKKEENHPAAVVLHPIQPSSQWAVEDAAQSNPQGAPTENADNAPIDNSLALVLHSSSKQQRGIDPDEAIRGGGNGRDPPGESPSARPIFDYRYAGNGSGGSTGSNESGSAASGSDAGGAYRRRFRNVQWVDPKSIEDENEIDFGILAKYERFSAHDAADYTEYGSDQSSTRNTMGDSRIRIATISSGYKKANFFVREDLDQRIYFHDLEDAISYMARRGYAKMEKNTEKEWMKLLARAHQVVKVGPTKKKQRYRKGKLILIMTKPILDKNDTGASKYKDKASSSQISTTSTATTHTSLGRSIRCGYKSYSEKFLAEQEQERCQMLLTNGEAGPMPPSSQRLMLTAVDPEPSAAALLQLTNGAMSVLDEGEGEDKSRSTSSKKSSNSDARRGVYGGGVRYFTPDKSYDEDSEDRLSVEEEEEDTEEEVFESDDEEGETEQEGVDFKNSDLGSMISEEESYRNQNDGVSSVASSTINSEMPSIVRQSGVQIDPKSAGSKNALNQRRAPTPFDKQSMGRQTCPPDMAPISDDSASSASWDGKQ
eukprot:scaffold595_cov182-Alexandrium_tamarense.AAC.4